MPSYQTDILPMFRQTDRDFMLNIVAFPRNNPTTAIDLHKYDDVKANAADILSCVQDGSMPPDDPWPTNHPDWIQTFQDWMAAGFPEFDPVAQSGFIVTNQDTF